MDLEDSSRKMVASTLAISITERLKAVVHLSLLMALFTKEISIVMLLRLRVECIKIEKSLTKEVLEITNLMENVSREDRITVSKELISMGSESMAV